MLNSSSWVVVGLDNGGNCNSATVLDGLGRFLVDRLVESPSRVQEGPDVAIEALAGCPRPCARHHGGGAGVGALSSAWDAGACQPRRCDLLEGSDELLRSTLARVRYSRRARAPLEVPVIYNNDGNAAALYAHHSHFGREAALHSSVSAIVGTGLGGGVIEAGRVISGAAGMAGELGHVHIPMQGLLADGQPIPECNCGFVGDVESVASLTGIERKPPAVLADALSGPRAREKGVDQRGREAGPRLRRLRRPAGTRDLQSAGDGDRRLFTIASNFIDPSAYFVGGGVVEASPRFREWFAHARARAHSTARRAARGRDVRAHCRPGHGRCKRGPRSAALDSAQHALIGTVGNRADFTRRRPHGGGVPAESG